MIGSCFLSGITVLWRRLSATPLGADNNYSSMIMNIHKNLYIILIVILSIMCNPEVVNNTQTGLFYGSQGGFPAPNQHVFAEIQDSLCIINCYFPLKGEIFKILEDTLVRVEREIVTYQGKYSTLTFDGKIIFSTDSLFNGYKIENVVVEPDSSKRNLLNKYRINSKPWN